MKPTKILVMILFAALGSATACNCEDPTGVRLQTSIIFEVRPDEGGGDDMFDPVEDGIDFGELNAGKKETKTVKVFIANPAAKDLTIGTIEIVEKGEPFKVSGLDENTVIPADEERSFEVTYAPPDPGKPSRGEDQATLRVNSDAPGQEQVDIDLTGKWLREKSVLAATAGPEGGDMAPYTAGMLLDFGREHLDTYIRPPMIIEFFNDGNTPVEITGWNDAAVPVQSALDMAAPGRPVFALGDDGEKPPFEVPAGGKRQIKVKYLPAYRGEATGNLEIAAADGEAPKFAFALKGTGVRQQLAVDPTDLQFPQMKLGAPPETMPFFVFNSGDAPIDSDPPALKDLLKIVPQPFEPGLETIRLAPETAAEFSLEPFTLPANYAVFPSKEGGFEVKVTLERPKEATVSGAVLVDTSAGQGRVTLFGYQTAPLMVINPENVGSAEVRGNLAGDKATLTHTFYVCNTGSENLEIRSVALIEYDLARGDFYTLTEAPATFPHLVLPQELPVPVNGGAPSNVDCRPGPGLEPVPITVEFVITSAQQKALTEGMGPNGECLPTEVRADIVVQTNDPRQDRACELPALPATVAEAGGPDFALYRNCFHKFPVKVRPATGCGATLGTTDGGSEPLPEDGGTP